MGTFVGHVLPGAGFLMIGVWHLVNIVHLYAKYPWKFESRTWYPAFLSREDRRYRHLELYLIAAGACLSIVSELFIGPVKHQPLDLDWSIPSKHLNNFEHASISLFFLIYALVALFTDLKAVPTPPGLLHLLGALVLSQEWLIFHLHSTDHMGVEGHYHWLLQLVIFTGFLALLLEVKLHNLFVLTLARAMSVAFQGVWLIQMGLVLWLPPLTPKGCRTVEEGDHKLVRCADEDFTNRAKALANLQFAWLLAGMLTFTLLLCAWKMSSYRENRTYLRLDGMVEQGTDGKDLEAGQPMFNQLSPASSTDMSSLTMESLSPKVETGR